MGGKNEKREKSMYIMIAMKKNPGAGEDLTK